MLCNMSINSKQKKRYVCDLVSHTVCRRSNFLMRWRTRRPQRRPLSQHSKPERDVRQSTSKRAGQKTHPRRPCAFLFGTTCVSFRDTATCVDASLCILSGHTARNGIASYIHVHWRLRTTRQQGAMMLQSRYSVDEYLKRRPVLVSSPILTNRSWSRRPCAGPRPWTSPSLLQPMNRKDDARDSDGPPGEPNASTTVNCHGHAVGLPATLSHFKPSASRYAKKTAQSETKTKLSTNTRTDPSNTERTHLQGNGPSSPKIKRRNPHLATHE